MSVSCRSCVYWHRCCRIISTLSTSSLSSSWTWRKTSPYFYWNLSWGPRERMIHKRLPVGAILPQGHALELDSVVAHSSALQRIRNSKQQQSLSLSLATQKKVTPFQKVPKLRQPRQRGEPTAFWDAASKRKPVSCKKVCMLYCQLQTVITWGSRKHIGVDGSDHPQFQPNTCQSTGHQMMS